MSLDDVVNVTITANTVAPTRLGFGTPLIMAVHSANAAVLAEYASPKEITDAGFSATSAVSRIATKIFSQNPRPTKVLVGKRSLPYTQLIKLFPVNVTEGYVYRFNIVDPAGVAIAIEYTVLAAATVATICTALTALLAPSADNVATDVVTHVLITTTAGKLVNLTGLPNPTHLKIQSTTVDPGIATDLGIIEALDATTWYAVLLDSESENEVKAAAAWVEARRKQLFYTTSDSEILDVAVTTDLASDLKASGYARTAGIFSASELLSYSAAAWAGGMLPTDPGAGTWCYRTLKAVTVDTLTGGQVTQCHNKNLNTYTVKGGVSVTSEGKSASGEFVDITHFTDWLHARMQEGIFAAFANASASGSKIPYTDLGVEIIRSIMLAKLAAGVVAGGLAADPAPTVTAPKVKDIDPGDKVARMLPDMQFSATLAGAIHATTINGVLSI
jgi:hypothetical protein